MSVTEGQKDQILSGIRIGMPLEDMLVLCELSPQEMQDLQKDEFFMARAASMTKTLSYNLLKNLQDTIDIQVRKGKDHAITWLLEKTNPFFAAKSDAGDKPGVVNIFTQSTDLVASDTVSVNLYDTEKPEDITPDIEENNGEEPSED